MHKDKEGKAQSNGDEWHRGEHNGRCPEILQPRAPPTRRNVENGRVYAVICQSCGGISVPCTPVWVHVGRAEMFASLGHRLPQVALGRAWACRGTDHPQLIFHVSPVAPRDRRMIRRQRQVGESIGSHAIISTAKPPLPVSSVGKADQDAGVAHFGTVTCKAARNHGHENEEKATGQVCTPAPSMWLQQRRASHFPHIPQRPRRHGCQLCACRLLYGEETGCA
mmetsp:Transcript_54178/g.117038  ORF Transcript_54178/g.117038 Transcript_54178/m.117038 type:complete len:223 (+) Transcript_54178:1360-2028(+)